MKQCDVTITEGTLESEKCRKYTHTLEPQREEAELVKQTGRSIHNYEGG